MRRPSLGGDGAAGVNARDRGDERTLEGADSSSTSRIVANVRFVPAVAEGIVVGRVGVCPL